MATRTSYNSYPSADQPIQTMLSNSSFARPKMSLREILSLNPNDNKTRWGLSLEVLEDRMMLSSVEIFAAGSTGEENLDLLIDGEVVQTFFNVGGDASTRDFQRFTFETSQTITPGNIGIRFSNDAFDPSIGLDRDLIVDRIAVDGVSVEAEDPSTRSTGIFADGGLTGPGFFETEVLNINGTLSFADPGSGGGGSTGSGDRIEFDASGSTGEELVQLLINGEVVETFGFFLADPGVTQTFTFNSDEPNISIEDIRLEFVNDAFDASTGLDRNVFISEFRVIDTDTVGSALVQTASTSDANVISSGIFVDGVGITEGLGAGGFLAGNGFVEIVSDGSTGVGDRIEFDAFGTTGEELVALLVDDRPEAFFQLNTPGVTQTFSFASDDPNISIEDIRLQFVNDLFDPSTGTDRNVQIFEFRVVDGDTGAVQTARTTDANVLSSGIFANGAITQGFGAGGFLAGEFNGSSFVEISDTGAAASLSLDPSFQFTSNEDLTFGPSFGPQGQIASFGFSSGQLLVVGDDGVPLTSFGTNGIVDLDEILLEQAAQQAGFATNPNLSINDLEFFDDGSLLVTGVLTDFTTDFRGILAAESFIAKLNPDGTLDSSFSQQGVLQGTLIRQVATDGRLEAAIDSSGGIVLFGPHDDGNFSDPPSFVVSRLNADGSVDSTFGNDGNQFISVAGFENATTDLGALTNFLDITDSGEIVVAFTFQTEGFEESLGIVRLLADGSLDQGFGQNGTFTVADGEISGGRGGVVTPIRLTPDGGIAIGFNAEGDIPALLLLDSAGVSTEIFLTPVDPSVGSNRVDGLAVDQSGNIVLRYVQGFGGPVANLPNVLVTLSPSGDVISEILLDTEELEFLDIFSEIVLDPNNRLVTNGDSTSSPVFLANRLARFEFV